MTVTDRPKLLEKVSYGFGDLASVLFWQTFMLYLTYFYTDVALIPLASLLLMFSLVRSWDWINDPIMGMIADRTKTRWGKYRPYLLWFCVPFAVAGVLCFTVPDFDQAGRFRWALVTYILLMTLYTVINIPYTALLGVLSPESDDRTSISSIKFMFAFVAGIIVSATLLPMTDWLGGGDEARGWQNSFILFGAAAIAFFLIAFIGTKERVQPPVGQKTPVLRDLSDLVKNKPWLILLISTLVFILFFGTRGNITVHYIKYYIVSHEVWLPFVGSKTYEFKGLTSIFNTVGQICSLLGVLVIFATYKMVDKKKLFIVLFLISIASAASFYLVSPEHIYVILLLQAIGNLTGGPLSVLLWAMYADTADYGEWKFGRRATGLIFSASTMSQKIGWFLSAILAISLMNSVGFVANVEQSEESLGALVLLMSLIPAGLGLVSVLLISFYPLNNRRVAEIESELAKRKSQADSGLA